MKNYSRIFVTGDIHGDVKDLQFRSICASLTKDDLLIILGDCAFEYTSYYHPEVLSEKDIKRQLWTVKNIPATIVCVQGNHETPFNQMHGKKVSMFGTEIIESNGIYFVPNGSSLVINDKKFLIIGGAFSVDKDYRLSYGYPWWEHEQMSKKAQEELFKQVNGKTFDFILTHTCPYNFRPFEMFLDNLDPEKVDDSMEQFLQKIYENVVFDKWFCGHWHTDKTVKDVTFVYNDVVKID